jgi:hypothetical protein
VSTTAVEVSNMVVEAGKREKGEGHFNMEKKVDAPSLPEIGVAIYNESYNYIHHDIYCTTFSDPCLW